MPSTKRFRYIFLKANGGFIATDAASHADAVKHLHKFANSFYPNLCDEREIRDVSIDSNNGIVSSNE